MAVVKIQGIDCVFRDVSEGEVVLYSELSKDEQYFRMISHPFTDDELVDIANREHQYTNAQKEWKERQDKLFETGVYAYINGIVTFIPGSYWCYTNFWTLENGEKPEYREDDRKFFLFHEYLRLGTNCLGLTRLKGRRQGATSIAMFFMWFIAGRKEHQLCGLTSFTDTAAQDAFQRMFMYGFKAMLPCFQADFDSDSENFIRFVKPVDRKKKGVLAVKREGLNSYCDFKPNAINSYDSNRQSYNVPDEAGKRSRINITSYWSRLYKTLLVGMNKVGFVYMPTTVGQKKEGGENYKVLYKNASQYEIDENTGLQVGVNTINRLVQFFMSAANCYAGCIDKFGNSVTDDPVVPILSNDGKWITEGARTIILRERARLSGEQLMEHRRDYPLDEFDAFSFESGSCEFNEENIRVQLQYLEDNKGKYFLRQVRLYWEQILEIDPLRNINRYREIVKFADDAKGDWLLYEMPKSENNFKIVGGHFEPENILDYGIGVDTFKGGFSINGSQGTICVGKKSSVEQGEEKGMYPVMFYVGRPRLVQHFYEEVRKACFWYGCKVNYEIDAGDYYYGYFEEKKSLRFLEWCPAVNPNKKHPLIKPGTESADPFQLAAELEAAKVYVDGTGIDHYNGHVHRIVFPHLLNQLLEYNHEERTPYDSVIACMMWLLITLKQTRPQQVAKYYKPLIKTFKLNV